MSRLIICIALLAMPAAARPPEAALKLQKEATVLLKKRLYVDAGRTFERTFAAYPARGALYNAGIAYKRGRDHVAAVRVFRQFLEVSAADGKVDKKVKEVKKQLERLRKELARTHVQVRLTLQPATATFSVDDRPRTPKEAEELWLTPGSHSVTATAPAHIDREITLDLQLGVPITPTLALTPAPKFGALAVRSVPGGASVFRDNKAIGHTPLHLKLSPGEYSLEARLEGHVSQRRTVAVAADEVATLNFQMAPAPVAEVAPDVEAGTPVYKSWWLWTIVGAVVAGGVTAAVLATQEPDPVNAPESDFGTWTVP